MLITAPVHCLVAPAADGTMRLPHKIAPLLDFAIGIAVLTIGLLGLYGYIPAIASVSPYLISMGAVYTGTLFLGIMFRVKQKSCPEWYLFKTPQPTTDS